MASRPKWWIGWIQVVLVASLLLIDPAHSCEDSAADTGCAAVSDCQPLNQDNHTDTDNHPCDVCPVCHASILSQDGSQPSASVIQPVLSGLEAVRVRPDPVLIEGPPQPPRA